MNPAVRAIGVSHTDYKDDFRPNPRSRSCCFLIVYEVKTLLFTCKHNFSRPTREQRLHGALRASADSCGLSVGGGTETLNHFTGGTSLYRSRGCLSHHLDFPVVGLDIIAEVLDFLPTVHCCRQLVLEVLELVGRLKVKPQKENWAHKNRRS